MPVSLIPQQRPTHRSLREVLSSLTGGDFFVGLSLAALFLVILAYAGLTLYESRLNSQLQKYKEQYRGLQQNRGLQDRVDASEFAQRAQAIKKLLNAHVDADPLFSFLENYTHPQVTWSALTFDVSTGVLKLGGSASGYQSLSEQMVLWQKSSQVRHVSVSNFVIGNDGLLHFSAELLLSPNAFVSSLPAS